MSKPSAAMQLLEKHFDTAFAAPDGIKKLRELILTLAMQGKLAPQNANDQPASELLKEIEAEKKRLVKDGKIKQQKPLPVIKPEEVPYELPKGWAWVRLGKIADYNGRKNVSPEEIAPDTWLLDLEDIEKDTSKIIYRANYLERQSKSTKSVFRKGDILYGKLRPYLDKVIVADHDGVCTTEIVPIVPFNGIDSQFVKWLLKRPSFLEHVNSLMYGVKMPRLGTEDAINSIHPLPPLAEQRRIVAKIDQLMVRCDELEKLQADHDQERIATQTAALNRLLTATEGETFSTAWAFITQNFGELYSVKENVAELRKAILQLAVMGKLVPQNSNDQPAKELLKEIQAEKKRLVKAGKIKVPKPLPEINPEEMPYDLPKGWKWIMIQECYYPIGSRYNQIQTKDYRDSGLFPVVDQGKSFIAGFCNDEAKVLKIDTPVIVFGDHTKNLKYVDFDFIIGADGVKILNPYKFIDSRFLYYVIRSYDLTDRGYARHFKVLNEKLVPLAPLAEQHRIVAKIDQLMALCDELEKQIDAATRKQTALLNAVMAQA